MDRFSRKRKYLPVTSRQNRGGEDETFVNSICKCFPHLQVVTVTITHLGVAKYRENKVPVPRVLTYLSAASVVRSLVRFSSAPDCLVSPTCDFYLIYQGYMLQSQELCGDVFLSQGLDED